MTARQHGDTETPAKGFEARLEDGFEWIQHHFREIAMVVGGLLLVAVIIVAIVERNRSAEDAAQTALLSIELDFEQAMGATNRAAILPEPANEEVAQQAREAALASLVALIEEHSGSDAAVAASIRAAEMEVDLARLDDADARLAALSEALSADDPRRAIAGRLRGFTLEQRGRHAEAGEVYSQAATILSYPARPLLFLSAAYSFERAGDTEQAITAFEQVLAAAPEFAEAEGVIGRMRVLEARSAQSEPAAAAPGTAKEGAAGS